MKTIRKKSFVKLAVLAFLAAGCLISCKQNSQNDPSTAELQSRLNDIMQQYQEAQKNCDDYSLQLAERDSTIQAQAAEIQRLIDQLNAAPQVNNTKATRKSARANRRATNELKSLQKEIAQLQARLEQTTQELNALKSTDGYADRAELARLQQIIRDQDRQIVNLANDKVILTNSNDSLNAHIAYIVQESKKNVAEPVVADNTNYAEQVALLEARVASQQTEIARLQEELSKQIAALAEAQAAQKAAEKSAADNKAAAAKTKGNVNKKLAALEAQCQEYLEEIERLRKENTMLKTENDSLRNQVVLFKRSAEDVAAQNSKMREQVNRASVLTTDNIVVTPLKRTTSTTGKPTNRASATAAFQIDGMLLSNNVIDPGTITIYAVITSPSNVVLQNGTIDQTFNANGVTSRYTMVQAFEFTGEARAFSMLWNKDNDIDLEAGIYRVTLYANSHIIGVSEFKLK